MARQGHGAVGALLLLDGEDQIAAAVARELGVEVVVKTPPGPTKARALQWLAAHPLMAGVGAVLILDVGSILPAGFFSSLRLPEGAGAMQTMLRGTGAGVGEAAAISESVAQSSEDRGRAALHWSVRLRGTGSIFRRDAFEYVISRQVTRVEDLECSLLLAAAGYRIALLEESEVFDEKPHDVASAASQRARWILGRYELVVRHPGAFLRLLLRRPAEGLAFVAEIFGRPLALTSLLRIAAGVVCLVSSGALLQIIGALLVASGTIDIIAHVRSPRAARAALSLLVAWVRAIFLAPRALFRWMRAKRS